MLHARVDAAGARSLEEGRMKFIGDVHGHTDRLARMLKPEFQYMQLGDMALGFKGVLLPKYDNLTFVRGNHDSPEACRATLVNLV